jgi:hypothetical protein
MACKRLTFGQYIHYNLLSSKTHQSFPSDPYSTQYLMIFSEFCHFIAVPVVALLPRFCRSGNWFQRRIDEALHYTECVWRHRLESDLKRTNDGWQHHDKACFFMPAAGSWTIIVTQPIRTRDSSALVHSLRRICKCMCMHCIQLAMHVDMVYNSLRIAQF